MNGHTGPSVIVNKGGFFTAIVKGVFGVVIVLVLCGTALGLYGLRLADRWMEQFTAGGAAALLHWQDLPPIVRDTFNDRRALDYRDSLQIRSALQEDMATVSISNIGDEMVSLLSLRAILQDSDERVHGSNSFKAVTPIAFADWRGPLPPGETRRLAWYVGEVGRDTQVKIELSDLRVFNSTPPEQPRKPTDADEETRTEGADLAHVAS